jgi:hypothetical protein
MLQQLYGAVHRPGVCVTRHCPTPTLPQPPGNASRPHTSRCRQLILVYVARFSASSPALRHHEALSCQEIGAARPAVAPPAHQPAAGGRRGGVVDVVRTAHKRLPGVVRGQRLRHRLHVAPDDGTGRARGAPARQVRGHRVRIGPTHVRAGVYVVARRGGCVCGCTCGMRAVQLVWVCHRMVCRGCCGARCGVCRSRSCHRRVVGHSSWVCIKSPGGCAAWRHSLLLPLLLLLLWPQRVCCVHRVVVVVVGARKAAACVRRSTSALGAWGERACVRACAGAGVCW